MDYTTSSLERQRMLDAYAVQQKSRSISLSVSTDDVVVREQLRQLHEPITLFGEGPYERRERLRLLVARDLLTKESDVKFVPLVPPEPVTATTVVPKTQPPNKSIPPVQNETFYSEGSKELLQARRKIAAASLRNSLARGSFMIDFFRDMPRPQYLLDIDKTATDIRENISTISSQVADDRPLTDGKFSGATNSEMKPLLFATASWSGFIKLWDVERCNHIQTLSGHNDRVHCLAWRESFGSEGGKVTCMGQQPSILADSSFTDAEKLNKLNEDGTHHLEHDRHSAANGIGDIKNGSSSSNGSLVFSSPGVVEIASGSADGTINLYSTSNPNPLHTFHQHELRINRIAFHPLAGYIASTSHDETWRLFDLETQTELLIQEGHGSIVYPLAFHPDGGLLLTGGGGGDIIGWDLRSGKGILRYEGAHVKQLLNLDFHPLFPHTFASSSEDHTTKIWDLRKSKGWNSKNGGNNKENRGNKSTGRKGSSWKALRKKGSGEDCVHILLAHNKLVSCCKFEPRYGRFLITGGYDCLIKIWSAVDYTPICQVIGNESKIMGIDISGSLIGSVGFDRTWKLWKLGIKPAEEWPHFIV